jgi:hypothetical protein
MSSAGTMLDDLDAAPTNPQDDDLVKRILSEINTPSGGNPIQMPPAPSARAMSGGQLPPINSLTSLTMDPSPATAHMIGSQHPTPADFAHAMHGMPMMMPPNMQQQQPMMMPMMQQAPQEGFLSGLSGFSLTREFKTPLLVALIVFVVSLPIINTMIGLYMPSLLRMGGDLTTLGLVLKSLLGGALFWILQRVVAPLI